MKPVTACVLILVLATANALFAQENPQPAQRRQSSLFDRFFMLPGIEFSTEQQPKVDELRKEFEPKLIENQQKWNQVLTREQMQAILEIQNSGKRGAERRAAVAEAVKLTDDQRARQQTLRRERDELRVAIRERLIALLTPEQRAKLQQPQRPAQGERRSPMRSTYTNVKYGPHARNVMDVWLAKSDKPTPVLVSIHGGGFRMGNKSVARPLLQDCLDAGISVVAITYRLSDQAIAPAQFHDSARAIQFIRHNAKEWNLDPDRIAATGGSAGAGISLWLGFHDDLADPDNEDPVLRQSTRLTCLSVYNGQTSYDPRFLRELFPNSNTYAHPALAQLFGADLSDLDNLPREKYKLFEEVSALTHLTKDDVPAQLIYASDFDTPVTNQAIGIHHPRFGKVLKEKMDALGIECVVHTNSSRGAADGGLTIAFVKKHFGIE